MAIRVCDAIMGSGKAQPLDSVVLTEHGYIKMRDIHIGDMVFGEDGICHAVTGVFPQGFKSVYRVKFSDKTSVECCDEHLWTYQFPQDKAKGKWRTNSLREIMDMPLFTSTNRGDKNWQLFIPMAKPLRFSKKDVPIDPYALGVLLGDGCFQPTSISFMNAEESVVNAVESALSQDFYLSAQGDRNMYRIVDRMQSPRNNVNRMIRWIDDYGLRCCHSEDKYIPRDYLLNDIDSRYALLRGLIDADGDSTGGNISYCTTSKMLAGNVSFLVQSIGGTATISEKDTYYVKDSERITCKTAYVCYIRTPNDKLICSSEKHLRNLGGRKRNTGVCRSIRNIEYVGEKECQCILVDSDSHLYLTNDCIVTHNTSAVIKHMERNPDKRYIYITPFLDEAKRIRQSCEKLRFVEPNDKLPEFGYSKYSHLVHLLKEGRNIASTHQMFRHFRNELITLVQAGHYTLVVDEAVDVFQELVLKKSDLDIVAMMGWVNENGENAVTNDTPTYQGDRFRDVFDLAQNGNFAVVSESGDTYYWVMSKGFFEAFDDVIILTYMFSAQTLKYYFDMNHIEFSYIGIEHPEPRVYEFSEDGGYIPDYVGMLSEKLRVFSNRKLNEIGDRETALSSNWFQRRKSVGNADLETLRCNLKNFFMNYMKEFPSDARLWSTFKSVAGNLRGKGYYNSGIAYNTKATNAYRHKKVLAYCVNIFMKPEEKRYFIAHDVDVREDDAAISTMIQWIWRSAIRDGEEIWIYVPSLRMRKLLTDWIKGVEQKYREYIANRTVVIK